LEGGEQKIYDEIYCAGGEMENRIKELFLTAGFTGTNDGQAQSTPAHGYAPMASDRQFPGCIKF
jgi:hypothetical protein